MIEDVHVSHTLGQDSHEGHDHHDHEGHDHDKHDHEGHDHDKHDHEHKGHDHDEHAHDDHEHHDHEGHDHEGHDHEHGGHGEFTVEYRYHCDSVADLNSIDTTWFNQFPATESISANLFTDTTQSATTLNKGNTKIAIK